jgi:hypothetical protein
MQTDSQNESRKKKKKSAISSCKEKRRHLVLFWLATNRRGMRTKNVMGPKNFLILAFLAVAGT